VTRPVLVSGNWKMHHNHFQAIETVQKLAALFRSAAVPRGREVSIHPPFTSLRSVQTAVESDGVPVSLGAQTCHHEDRGAFTGEVSAEFLAKLNVRYVIAGHSERRALCGETDDVVRVKVDAILRHAMVPILCVGESLAEREAGAAESRVRSQLVASLDGRAAAVVGGLVVAYEPIWAIGTGVNATPADAGTMASFIRSVIAAVAGTAAAATVRIQYGGSVTPENAGPLLAETDVDGLLVGGASLDAERFAAIVRA
jgi:triosephosphate isomerase (TIM)